MISREFNLYLHAGHSIPLVINVNQYDRGEQWLFKLFNSDGTQYVPSSGAIVGIKSDNLGIINTGSVDAQGRVVINETQQMTAAVGKAVFELVIDDGAHGTANFVVLVEPKPGDNADLSETDISMIEQAVEAASTIKPYGSPLVASTVAGMTDHEKVYVYVGSETGYTSGNWYYWDGSAWTSGGVYNSVAVQTDTTLTLSGVAADAKKTGDELNDLKSEISDIEEQIEGGTSDGLTSAIKSALLQLAQNVAYKDTNGQTYVDDLYDALYPPIVVTNITLNTNSLSFATLNSTQQLTATTTPTGGAVTWSSSNTSVATVSTTGLVTAIGYGNATITATSGSVSATCSVVIAQATVTSISAVYTQSGTVYDDASLDSLKSDLVVTSHWSNGATETVADTDYTLSGTLSEGTSTITVSYGGKTTTFNVTVSVASYYDYVPTNVQRGATFDASTGEVISAGQYSAITEEYIPVESNTVIAYTNAPNNITWTVVMYDSSKNYINQVRVNPNPATNVGALGITSEQAAYVRIYWYNPNDSTFVANFRIYTGYHTVTASVGDINANTGAVDTSVTVRANSDYIPASESVTVYSCPFANSWYGWANSSSLGYGIRCYDSEKSFISNLDLGGLVNKDITNKALPTGTAFVRFVFQKTNGGTFPSIASESKHPFVVNDTAYLITEAS